MKKRLLSWLMVLTLCLTLLPTAALADTGAGESSGSETHDHYLCGTSHTCANMQDSEREFTAWTDAEAAKQYPSSGKTAANSLPNTAGNYYLTDNVTLVDSYWEPKSGTVLCLNGYSITSTRYSGAVTVGGGVEFTLVDCNGSKNTYRFEEDMYKLWKLNESGSHEVTGGIVTSTGSGSGVLVQNGGKFNMYGGTIVGNSGTTVSTGGASGRRGGGVYVKDAASRFDMYGGAITGNTAGGGYATLGGGGVFVNSGEFDMYGGEITNNAATANADNGGGVQVLGNGTFNMTGGTIGGEGKGNTSGWSGGGVYVNGATFKMSGDAAIIGNSARSGGSGVDMPDGTFTMSGNAKIVNNKVTGKWNDCGGVCVSKGTLTVSGNVQITGNTKDSKVSVKNNVYLGGNYQGMSTITIDEGGLNDSAQIGVTTNDKPEGETEVQIATGAAENKDYTEIITSDDDTYEVAHDSTNATKLVLKVAPEKPHTHFLCTTGNTCTKVGGHNCGSSKTAFIKWTDELARQQNGEEKTAANSLPNAADKYYLTGPVTLVDSYWEPKSGTVLCLNGYSITMNGNDEAIKVGKNVTFTLTDCKGGKSEYGKITHGTAGGGSKYTDNGVDVSSGGTFNMYGGSIAGNTGTCGGVYMDYATFNMYGGSITENTANNGGGVFMRNGTFNMSGGSITGNTTTSIGGGVYVIQGGEFTMSGGSITNNIATENGGGVYVGSVYSVSTGTFAVSGNVNITGNKVGEKLNNVYLYSGRTITIGGALTEGASIGVTPSSWPTGTATKKIATQATGGDQNYVKSDDNAYEVKYDNGNLVLGLKGSNPQPGKVDAGVKITAENANDPAPTEVVYGDTFNLGATLQSTGTAGRPITSDWTWTSSDRDVLSVTGSGSAATVKALKSGEATITVTYESENAKGTATATITVKQRQISVKVDDKEMTVGGALPTFTVTYGNFADNDTADTVLETQPVPTTTADGKTAGTFDITVEAPTIKSDYADKYTVGTPQKGTLTVKAASTPSTPSTPSSGSSSGSSTIKTETTTTNPDGSTTKTETKSDGTVIETTTNPDGSTSKTESKTTTKSNGSTVETVTETNTGADGSKSTSKTETTTAKDGSKTETKSETKTEADGTKSETKSETKTDANGVTSGTETTKTTAPNGSTGTTTTTTENGNTKTEAETKISNKAVEDAKKSGEAVKVPTEVKAGENSNSAPTIKVELPKNAGETKIEIPVSDVNSGTVAVIVHPDGTEEIVKDSKPTADGVELTVDGSATVKVIDNSKDFIDTRNHWSRDEVNFVVSREIFNGVGGNLFGVGRPMTRGMVNTVLARLAGVDTTPKNGQKWYEVGTEWAKANGITDGTNPEASVTREQLATLLYRFCGTPTVSGVLSFADAGEVSDYAQSALLWATQNDILNGVGNNRVAPNADAQRAQVAAMMARYLKNVG